MCQPQGWIIIPLELTGIKNKIIPCTKKAKNYWKTSVCLHTGGKIVEREDLEMKRKTFQGDLSPTLIFCISLIPRTEQLYRLNTGYE